jgi:hypothetical protein
MTLITGVVTSNVSPDYWARSDGLRTTKKRRLERASASLFEFWLSASGNEFSLTILVRYMISRVA